MTSMASGPWHDMQTSELVHEVVPSPNFNDRALPITMLVVHYTEMKPVETALARLTNVVGHSDVAPMRKIDPGELFPWDRLAEYGLCLKRPSKLEQIDPFHNEGAFILALERFGYDITEGRKTIEAFERRWRPEKIEGKPDAQLGAILWHLLLERDRGAAR